VKELGWGRTDVTGYSRISMSGSLPIAAMLGSERSVHCRVSLAPGNLILHIHTFASRMLSEPSRLDCSYGTFRASS
jgi:hypothetical protein